MFGDCKACPILREENAWLRKQLQEANDSFRALTGTLTQIQDGRNMGAEESELAPPSQNDEPPEKTDEASLAQAELEKKAMEIRRQTGRPVKPDF